VLVERPVATVLIDIDSLRPDHVGAYGYQKPTTPSIDRFAADAVRFENAYVANSPCMPSRSALTSGRYGIHNGVVTHGPLSQNRNTPARQRSWAGGPGEHIDERPWWTLPELFYNERVRTCAVSSFPRHPAPWFHTVWDEVYQPQEPRGETESFQTPRAEDVVNEAIDVIDDYADEEFFLYVQLWDPHAPYHRSDAEIAPFRDGDFPTHPTEAAIRDHATWDAWRSATHMGIESRADLEELIAHYDAEIRYTDTHVGRLLDALRKRGRYEDSTVVLTADHGEEFGEHGLYREHWSTHDGTQRVPLFVKPPAKASVTGGTAREHLVTNVDIAPTVAAYNDLEAPGRWDGQSLKPLIETVATDWRDEIVVEHGLYTAQRAIRTDRWKLIRTHHPGMWSAVIPRRQLFDMDADPHEQTNVASEHPDTVERLCNRLDSWVDTHRDGDDPLRVVAANGPSGFNSFKDDFEGL
jgi:arylsulfatase A-like enzyme